MYPKRPCAKRVYACWESIKTDGAKNTWKFGRQSLKRESPWAVWYYRKTIDFFFIIFIIILWTAVWCIATSCCRTRPVSKRHRSRCSYTSVCGPRNIVDVVTRYVCRTKYASERTGQCASEFEFQWLYTVRLFSSLWTRVARNSLVETIRRRRKWKKKNLRRQPRET